MWQGSRARGDGSWGTRDCSCTRRVCSEPGLPQPSFRKQRAGSFLRCWSAKPFPAGFEATLLFHRPSLPSSGLRQNCARGQALGEPSSSSTSPRRQVGSCFLALVAPYLAGVKRSKLLWQGNAALWGGTQVQPTPEDMGSRDTRHSASSEGSRTPHHLDLSFQRDL